MRNLPVALAASAVLHGALVAWIQTRPLEPEGATRVTQTPIEIVPAPAAGTPPTEVTLLADHSVVAATAPPSSPRHTPTAAKPRISNGTGPARGESGTREAAVTTAAPAATEPATTTPPKTKLMTMRHPKLERGPSAAFWDKFEANTKPLPPKDVYTERLADEIGVAEDHLRDPDWIANATPEQVHAERERLAAKRDEHARKHLQRDGTGTKADKETFTVKVDADGTVATIEDKPNLQRRGLGLKFDVTDAFMRSQGMDPYASYKLKVLDETRDERVALGKRHRTRELARSRQHVQAHLEHLWATAPDAAGRKHGLFELWDDCAETGSLEMVAGGAAARAHVLGFIRTKLPAGTADAYTADELARLNRRRKSSAPFSPYDAR